MNKHKFSIASRINSFKYALNGLIILFREEHNARIHLIAAIIAVLISYFLRISYGEWVAVILAIAFVFTTEIINSSIERIADFISPETNDSIKQIKDLSAAAVLISAITAIVIALIIFLPKILLSVS